MLKIKDDIDLKELEKFGFKWNDYCYEIELDSYTSWCLDENKKRQYTREKQSLIICGTDGRRIGYSVNCHCKINYGAIGYGYGIWDFDVVFDLIQARFSRKGW